MSELPPNVRPVKDRHGKVRYRFRKKGYRSTYLPGEPGTAAMFLAHAKILEEGELEKKPVESPAKINPKSLDDLHRRLKQSAKWRQKKDSTKRVQSNIMERFLNTVAKSGKRYGDRPVEKITVSWLETIFGQMWETPAAANVLRSILSTHMHHAQKLGWRIDNPVTATDKYQDGEGFHNWTDAEIEQYRQTHKIGTMARLTLELALNVAGRRCEVNKIERDHIRAGRIIVDHAKDNEETSVIMLPLTRAALEALPAAPIRFLITTAFGKPFSDAGMGNRMRKWCNEANLPHCSMHGLRKAMSRRLAESGATDAQGMAVTGHKKNETFAYYRAKANRSLLADAALSNLPDFLNVQPPENDGKTDA